MIVLTSIAPCFCEVLIFEWFYLQKAAVYFIDPINKIIIAFWFIS